MKWNDEWQYKVSTMGIINGQLIWEGYPAGYAAEKPETCQYEVSWNNLAEFYRRFGMSTPISLWNFKKVSTLNYSMVPGAILGNIIFSA